ncbi:hybrid sensor histidine kinase/response regulator [Natrononativus amylolyticus]|uniref:hybrid sensor histidine kinase/response regulator n=1 Tax=Natrononativus amylolyticus TaxID=2963434 RepID=UPI0020CBF2EB|nr:hybrid sensor histidine kinase/response regulator [Natrononativus amylolyticus]
MTTTATAGVELLLVEDRDADARFVERLIHEHQSARDPDGERGPIEVVDVVHVNRLADGLERVRTTAPDVVLLDLMLPDSRGLETVDRMVAHAPNVPVVVLTGQNETSVGVEAIQRGAQDYLNKGTATGELIVRTLRYAIERARHQRTLVDRNHRLALLNQIVRQDIRNDVSMIVGLGDQLRTRADPADEDAIEALLEAAHHAVDLTDTAAEVIDVIAGDDLEREPCDLLAVLESAVARLRRDRNLEIDVDRSGVEDEPIIVSASPMLESVFTHLLENAVDHSDRATPRVAVTTAATADRATVEIADDGVGIPDAQKELLADPDARLDSRSGMGVGLYLVTNLLEAFDGRLEIGDNYPRGARVTVTLSRISDREP